MDGAVEQINQDERILQIRLGKKRQIGRFNQVFPAQVEKNGGGISHDSAVTGPAVLSAWKKENQFAVFITGIEAVITHPITL
jgi:hypothetical protein